MAQFSGKGSGTETDPYQITNADELFEVRNDLSACYKMMNDVDLTEWIAEDNPVQGWNPIGSSISPFSGVFDGGGKTIKGLYINRNVDNVGLFGVVKNAEIRNVSLVNVSVTGNDNVGCVAGLTNMPYDNVIRNVVIVGAVVHGNNCVGGITGSMLMTYKGYWGDYADPAWDVSNTCCTVEGCYCSADIYAGCEVGGICGATNGEYNNSLGNHVFKSEIRNNMFNGRIVGTSEVGAIVGNIRETEGRHYASGGTYAGAWSENGNYTICENNIGSGSFFSEGTTGGISGSYSHDYKVYSYEGASSSVCSVLNNVSVADTLSGAGIYRITNYELPGNYAYSGTVGIVDGRTCQLEDNDYNGASYGLRTLKRKTTYEGLGFDFNSDWAIIDSESLPYNIHQGRPASDVVLNTEESNVVSGSADSPGKVYVIHSGHFYEAIVTDGMWSVQIGSVCSGDCIEVIAHQEGMMPSIPVIIKSSVTATGISKVTGLGDTTEPVVFDVTGRHHRQPVRGALNIMNGKKVFIKR